MALTVVWREGMRFCSSTPAGELMCDESSEVGRAYPSAPELLLASLGSCVGSVLVYFAQRHNISLEGMKIHLDYRVAENPHRIGEIDVQIEAPNAASKKEQETLERVAHTCLIHNTLTHSPQIALSVSGGMSAR